MAQKIFNEESKEYKNKKRRILKPIFFSINVIKIIPMMSAKKNATQTNSQMAVSSFS